MTQNFKIYAIVGASLYTVDSSSTPLPPTSEHIEMNEPRPTQYHIAQADGTWIEKIPVPQVVSKAQAVLSLSHASIWPAFGAYLNAGDTPVEHKLVWENITEVRRDSSMLNEIAGILGLTDRQVDDLFIAADQIKI